MTANDSKSYLAYWNKLRDQYNPALAEKIETNPKGPKFNFSDRVRTTKYKNIFSKGYTENWSREIFIIDSVLRTNTWTCKIKDLNGEKNNRKFF